MDAATLAKHRSAVITVLGSAAEDFKGVCETGVHNRIRELQESVDQVLSIQSRNPLHLVQLTARGLRRQLLHQATIALMPRAARFIDQFGAEVDNEHAKSVVNHALNRPLRLGYAAGELHYSEEFDRPNENWMNAHHPGWQSELARRVDPTETPKKGTTVYDPTALDPLLKDLVRNLGIEGRIEHVVQILADFYEQELRAGRAPHFARPEDQEALKELHQAFVQVAQSKASLDEVLQEVTRLRDALEARGLETGFLPPTNRRELMLEELAKHDWKGLPAETIRVMPDVLQRLRAPSQQTLQQQVVSILEGDRRAKGEWRADLANIRRQLEQLETAKRDTAAGLDEAGLAALDEQIKQVDKQRNEIVGHLYRLEDRGAAFRAIQPLLAQWDKNPASFDQLVRSRLQTRASDQQLQQVLVRMDDRALRGLLLSENGESLSPFGIHMLGAYGGVYQAPRGSPKGDLFGWASAEAEAQVAQSMPIDLGQIRALVDQAIEMGDIRSIPVCYWNALKPFWMELTEDTLHYRNEQKMRVYHQLPASIQQGMLDLHFSKIPAGAGRDSSLLTYGDMFPEGLIKHAAAYARETLRLLAAYVRETLRPRYSSQQAFNCTTRVSNLPDYVQQALLPHFIEATDQASDDAAWKACSDVAKAGYEKALFSQWPQELQRQYLSWFYTLCSDSRLDRVGLDNLQSGARPMAEKHLDLLMPYIPAFSKTAGYHASNFSRNLLEKVSDGLWEAEWAKPVSGASVIRAYIDMFADDKSRMEHLAGWYDRQHQPDSAQMIRYLLVSRGSAPWTDVSEVPITPLLDDIMNSHSILGSREWPSPVAVRAWLTRQLEQNPLYLTAEADKLDDAQSLKTFWHHLAPHPDLLIPYLGPQLTSSKAQTLLWTVTREEDLQKALSKILEIPREVLKTMPATVIPLLMRMGEAERNQVFAYCPELQSAATIREYIPTQNLYDLATHLRRLKEEDRFMPLIEAQIAKAMELQTDRDSPHAGVPDNILSLARALTAGHYPLSLIKPFFEKFLVPNPAYVSRVGGELLYVAAENLHPEAVQLVFDSGMSPYQVQDSDRRVRLPIQCLNGAIRSWTPPEERKRAEAVEKLFDAAYDRDYPIASLESSFDYRLGLLLLGFVREGNVPAHALFGLAETNRSAADLEERWELLTKKLLTPKALKILQDNIDHDFTKERVLGILNEAKALVESGRSSSSSEHRSNRW